MVLGQMVAHFTMRTKDLYENADENFGNLKKDDLSIEISNISTRIFTLIQNNNFWFFNVLGHKCKKPP